MRQSMSRLTIIVAVILLLNACGWERKVIFKQGRGSASIEIQQPFPANGWGLRVILRINESAKTLYEVRGDTFLEFADVSWSADNSRVTVFTCGTPYLQLAYDLTGNHSLLFGPLQSAAASHIRFEYHLDQNKMRDEDTFLWACSADGKEAFLRRYPDAVPR
jgi:hypothetical protein